MPKRWPRIAIASTFSLLAFAAIYFSPQILVLIPALIVVCAVHVFAMDSGWPKGNGYLLLQMFVDVGVCIGIYLMVG